MFGWLLYLREAERRRSDRSEINKALQNCIRIARREELLESDKYWKLFALICGGLLIAVAVGWLKSDDEDGSGISIRLS